MSDSEETPETIISKRDQKRELRKKKQEEKKKQKEEIPEWEKFERKTKEEKEQREKEKKAQAQTNNEKESQKKKKDPAEKVKKSKPVPPLSAMKFFGEENNRGKAKPLGKEELFEMWSKLSDEEKQPFKKKAIEDKKRYEQEMEAFKQFQDTQPKKTGKKERRG